MSEKLCKTCGETKALSEFSYNCGTKDRKQNRCRSCDNKYSKFNYLNNIEERRISRKKWIEENREKHNETARRYWNVSHGKVTQDLIRKFDTALSETRRKANLVRIGQLELYVLYLLDKYNFFWKDEILGTICKDLLTLDIKVEENKHNSKYLNRIKAYYGYKNKQKEKENEMQL